MLDTPTFIYLSILLIGFGYIAGNSRSFNKYKLTLLVLFLFPFISVLNFSKAHLLTMLGAFLFGFFLPYASYLEFIGKNLSDLINAIRYKNAYEDIKRKIDEVEELRKKYEKTQNQENYKQQEQAREKRRQESKNYRKQQKSQQSQNHYQKQGTSSSSSNGSTRAYYLAILDLRATKEHSYKDIKKAYRRQASKYHPDKHQNKSPEVIHQMNERFKEIKKAYEWLSLENK